MADFSKVLPAVVPIFGVIGLGWMLRWRRFLSEEADAPLLRLAVNVFYPCLIFDSVTGNPALARGDVVALAALAAMAG